MHTLTTQILGGTESASDGGGRHKLSAWMEIDRESVVIVLCWREENGVPRSYATFLLVAVLYAALHGNRHPSELQRLLEGLSFVREGKRHA